MVLEILTHPNVDIVIAEEARFICSGVLNRFNEQHIFMSYASGG